MSWRSSGWRLVVLPLGTPRNPGDHHKPSPFWMVERRERGSEFALSGVRSTLLGSSLSSEGGGVRGSRGWSSGRMLRGRASAGAVLEGIRKGRARRGMLPLGVSFWDGAGWGLQPGGRGACLSFRPGGCSVLSAERRGGLWGAPSGGHRACCSLSLLGGAGPPLVQHRPRVTYSGTAKGPLLGGLPIVSGLEGVCEA